MEDGGWRMEDGDDKERGRGGEGEKLRMEDEGR
jgi:hypothetical protein